MFRAHVLIIRRSKLHYTASGIITPIGGRLVHEMCVKIGKDMQSNTTISIKMYLMAILDIYIFRPLLAIFSLS